MSEEEKKAILIVNNMKKLAKIEFKHNITDTELETIDTLLNLIEKQQKEIERLNFKYTARGDRLRTELEKKDKIIDLMANQILYDDMKTEANKFVTSEEIIEYFTNEVEKEGK